MTFTDKLKQAVKSANSTLCVGLDPSPEFIPESIKSKFHSPEEQVSYFCRLIIDYTAEHCAAYKLNLGFFEALGRNGFAVFEEVIKHIPKEKISIADCKRGDISNTSEQYKKAFFDVFDVDALTLNPLMGFETLDAFSTDESKGVYVLALTSNPGAADFLKKPFNGYDMMAQYIATQLAERSKLSQTHLGMVIGATQPEAGSILSCYREAVVLIPGVGAQGGSVEQLAITLQNHPGIPLINSSRSIIYAGNDEANWPEQVSQKAKAFTMALKPITDLYV